MQKIDDTHFIYSPSDLVHFLSCNHSTFLDIKNFSEKMQKTEDSASNRLLQKKGFEHEAAYLARLKQEGKGVVEIPKEPKLEERARLTQEALRSGADVVFQGVFFNGTWRGDADFLVKINTPSALGNFSYEVQDTKLAQHEEPKFIIQLCAYTDMLTDLQGIRPKLIHLVLGDQRLVSFKTDDFFYYYLYAKRRFEAFVTAPPATSYPEPCKHCKFCKWANLCEAQWQSDDHLSLVANIQRSQIDKLCSDGVTTVAALATLDPAAKIIDLNSEVFQRLRAQASLQVHKRATGEDKCEIIPFVPGKGFSRLPAPDPGDLFFDMEGDPLHPGGLEYLFGVYFASLGKHMFVPFWAHSHDEERIAFGQFMKFIEDHLRESPNAHIYHYNHYETTALKRLACRYGVAEEQMDNLLRQKKFVDLYKVVRESVRVSEPAYSIKNMETFYMEKRNSTVATAGDSIVVYNEWRETQNAELLHQLAEYNEMDCLSTYKLREWLLTKRPDLGAWFKATSLESEPSTERKEWEIQYEQYQQRLLSNARESDRSMRQRIVHLLEFHNREAKPQWWAHFERQDKFEDEIIDDTECLGGLTLVGNPEPEKRSLIYTYSFPEQEYKLKPGDQPIIIEDAQNGINTAGTIHELDEDRHIIKIKRGTAKGPLPGKLNLGPPSPFDSKVIRAAVYRVADSIAAGRNDYPALLDILNRAKPRLKGKTANTPILGDGDLLAESIRAAVELDNSYLFIQGPPGAGKTYTSAHIIIALLQQGKRVGVAANSHKAIHNLLDEVESVATKEEFNFRGAKKASSGNDDSIYEGHNIRSVSKNEEIGSAVSLLAGTVWLFADERFDRQLDYLIIEEAGQVSVANVVAMGASAKNIILVGDQMQLGQPIQGVHPGEAGLSILEFLLGDLATIPPDRGIFLSNTRRLNPGICTFISSAFYDGRLAPDEQNSQRRLIFGAPLKGITPEGIHFLPVEHSGCSQKSAEEGAVIKEYYHALLQQKFHDKDGTERQLQPEDILVVSPYNVQVNHLRAILPAGARVGTVDKFQGQEAPVVLVSMVTSSAEDLPRNIEFLYSKNRLNVALSRAQCLAVVAANPKLFEIPCGTVEQMKLVNTFCWLKDYSTGNNQRIYGE